MHEFHCLRGETNVSRAAPVIQFGPSWAPLQSDFIPNWALLQSDFIPNWPYSSRTLVVRLPCAHSSEHTVIRHRAGLAMDSLSTEGKAEV